MPSHPERLTIAEAARRSNHAPVSLRQAAQRGALNAERVGEGNRATWYTTTDDLAAYLAQRRSWKTYHGTLGDAESASRANAVAEDTTDQARRQEA